MYLNTIQEPIKILILSYLHDSPKQRPEIAMVVAELQKLKSSCQKPVLFNIVEFESHSKLQQKTNERLLEKQRETNEQLLEKQRETNEQLLEKQRETNEQLLEKQRELAEMKKILQEIQRDCS